MKKQTLIIEEIKNNPQLLLNKIRFCGKQIFFYYKIDSSKIYLIYYDIKDRTKIIKFNYFLISKIETWFGYDIETIEVF